MHIWRCTPTNLVLSGYPYKLVLSDLNTLTFEQRISLASYTRYTNIIQRLTDHVKHLDLYIPAPTPPSAPTPTTVPPPIPQPPPAPARTTLRLAVRLIPRFVSAAIKVEIALWMITRGLQYSDWRYLTFMFAGFLWWAWECTGMLRTEQRRETQRRGGALPGQQNAQGNVENVVVRGPGPGGLPDPGRRTSAASRQRRGPNPIPLFGLAYERRCLRLFYHDPSSTRPTTSATDHRIPHSERNLPLAPREPGLVWTYLVMPLYLLALSLWPDGDNARRAAIREREVHMRLLSQKLTEAAQQAETSEMNAADSTITPDTIPASATAASAPNPVMPKNLGPKAVQYWRRVLSRGETIDWEEERAAQAELLGRAGRDAGGAVEEEPMGLF